MLYIPKLNEFYLEKFTNSYSICINTGCWLWLKSLSGSGYGRFCINGIRLLAHRISYKHFKGEIPEGLIIDHLCKIPNCVNPDHLDAVTQKINVLRGDSFALTNKLKTHCSNGHEFTDENTRIWVKSNGAEKRKCRMCAYLWEQNLERKERNRIRALANYYKRRGLGLI